MSGIKTKFNCKSCHEPIYMDGDDYALLKEGFIDRPELCDECIIDDGYADDMIQDFSDADPEL